MHTNRYRLSPPPPPPPIQVTNPTNTRGNPNTVESYAHLETLEEPLILKGDEQLVIENTQYLAEDIITLRDNATLIIRDSFFEHNGKSGKNVSLTAMDNSRVIIENSIVNVPCGGTVSWTFTDKAALETSKVSSAGHDCFPVQRFGEMAGGEIVSWNGVHVIICDESTVDLKNSQNTVIDLCFSPGAVVHESFPKKPNYVYTFPNKQDSGIDFDLTLDGSSVQYWNIYTAPKADMTIKDTHNLMIYVMASRPWDRKSIILNGLHTGVHVDETLTMADSKLHLYNATVGAWDLVAAHNNRIIVRDSAVRNIRAEEDGVVIIENTSTANNIETEDNAEITVRNSTISNTISSSDLSKITLVNSVFSAAPSSEIFHVPPQTIRARNTSTITLTDTPLKGHVIEEGEGRVIAQ